MPRLEALAHAAETLMGNYRDGAPVTQEGVSLILQSIDRIKEILGVLEATEAEPAGADEDLITQLDRISADEGAPEEAAAPTVEAPAAPEVAQADEILPRPRQGR